MKTFFISLFLSLIGFCYAQVPPLENHTWKLEKIVTADSTLVVPNEITFNGILENSNFYQFGNCVFVGGNLTYDDTNQSFLIQESSIPLQVCPDEQELMDIEDFFQNEFFFDVFMASWHEPFTYAFSTTPDKIYLDITNSEGSIATFYDNFLSREEFLEDNISIYPNPVKDILNIRCSEMILQHISIFDLQGRILVNDNILENNQLDLSNLPLGIYVLQIKTNQGVSVKKLVKK
ncbi:T9SS type A sorting domain-containing protein [Flavobacterium sp. CS20]|uniref:T9SS type A sorting domain-containing protein n=1 Tax=Flavobacterium sp. CS20 TaxID=2775246 RepID=UPI001B39FEC4|nr:T9SS type A sorting domain-containing protein [Flavobacterium sp. CS20]QTY26332.1 T9SS type A sorting domain-containing protein [Flavobacterium sp. CS20]